MPEVRGRQMPGMDPTWLHMKKFQAGQGKIIIIVIINIIMEPGAQVAGHGQLILLSLTISASRSYLSQTISIISTTTTLPSDPLKLNLAIL